MGRPPKRPEDRRGEAIIGKVTESEQGVVEEWAKFTGKTVSDFVRDAVLEKCRALYDTAVANTPVPRPPAPKVQEG